MNKRISTILVLVNAVIGQFPLTPPKLHSELAVDLRANDVSALSEARFQEKVCTSTVLLRAFDKAVRRKPPVVAADAGLMQIQWREGVV